MARSFTAASTQYLSRAAGLVTAQPFTLATFFKANSAATNYVLMSLGVSGSADNQFNLVAAGAAGAVIAFEARTTASSNAVTSTAYTAGTWRHACAVAASATDRRVFLDGGGKGTNAVSRVPAGINRTFLAAHVAAAIDGYFDGAMAHTAIWNVALSDAEVAALAAGVSPLSIRPANLVAYWPLGLGSPEISLVGAVASTGMTLNGAPTIVPDGFRIQSFEPLPEHEMDPLPTVGGRIFGAAGDKVSLGSPSVLDNLVQAGQTMMVSEARRYADGPIVLAAKAASATAGWIWDILGGASVGKPLFSVFRATTATQVIGNTAMPAGAPCCLGVNWDASGASGNAGVQVYGNLLELKMDAQTMTTAAAGSGAIGADAAGDMYVGNYPLADTPWKGDLGWFVLKWKAGATPWTLDEFHQVQAGILQLKAARAAGGSLTRGLATINLSGAATLILEVKADGTVTDHSANALTATLTGTKQGSEQAGWFELQPGGFEDDLEPDHPDGGTDQVLYPYTSEFARSPGYVTAADKFTVWARSTAAGIFVADDRVPQIGYMIDGAYVDEVRSGASTPYLVNNVTGLSPSSKTIKFINGLRISTTGVRPYYGTYLSLVRFNAPATEVAVAVRSSPLKVLADSHLEGFWVDAAALSGCIQKLRWNLPSLYDGVQMFGAGGLSLHRVGADATARQKTADLLCADDPVAIVSNLAGNDWFNAYFGAVANYQSALSDFVDKVLAGFSGHVYLVGVVTPPPGSPYLGNNSQGDDIQDYRDAISAVAAAKGSRVTYLNTIAVVDAANFDTDLQHPNAAGHNQLFEFFQDEMLLVDVSAGAAMLAEGLLGVAKATTGNTEAQGSVVASKTVPTASLVQVAATDVGLAEALLFAALEWSAASEGLAGIASATVVPAAANQVLAPALTISSESGVVVATGVTPLAEALLGVAAARGGTAEALEQMVVSLSVAVPAEALGSVAGALVVPSEDLGSVLLALGASAEQLEQVSRALDAHAEAAADGSYVTFLLVPPENAVSAQPRVIAVIAQGRAVAVKASSLATNVRAS